MSVTEWLDRYIPGGVGSDFGRLCISAVLDEYGGAAEEQSALNLVYLLGADSSRQERPATRSAPQLGGGGREVAHPRRQRPAHLRDPSTGCPPARCTSASGWWRCASRGNGQVVCSFRAVAGPATSSADHVVLALPFTTLRQVDTVAVRHRARCTGGRSTRSRWGRNAKFFLQYSAPGVGPADGRPATPIPGAIVQGSLGRHRLPARRGRYPGRAARRHGRAGLGARVRPDQLSGNAARTDGRRLPGRLRGAVPGEPVAYNGKAFFVWSSGDPHILGAYSYLKVGQYTAFNGVQGQQEGTPALRRRADLGELPGLHRGRRCAAVTAAPMRSRPNAAARGRTPGRTPDR